MYHTMPMMDMILEAQFINRTNTMVRARKTIENAKRELEKLHIYLPAIPANLRDKAAVEAFSYEVGEVMEVVGRAAYEGEPCHWFEEIACATGEVLDL